MFLNRFFVVLGILLSLTLSQSQAGRFSEIGGLGSSTVGGVNSDYPSLYSASTDFNNYAGGCQGDWTIYIDSDLTEAIASYFGKNTNGHKITIRPTNGTKKTITFNHSYTSGIPGSIVIGASQNANENSLIKTDNFVIDGSPSDDTSVNLLSIIYSGSGNHIRVIHVYGDCDNTIIKNCSIINQTSSTLTSAAIAFTARKVSSVECIPDNGLIDNCVLVSAMNSITGSAVEYRTSASPDSLIPMSGMTIKNSLICGRKHGISITYPYWGTISNSTIRVNQNTSGYDCVGISYIATSYTNLTTVIDSCVFDVLSSKNTIASNGVWAVEFFGTSTGNTNFIVKNNIISSQNWVLRSTAAEVAYSALRLGSANFNYYILNNSINMCNQTTSLTGNLPASKCYILGLTSSSFTGKAIIKNNIFRTSHPGMAVIYKLGSGGSFTSDNNVIYTENNALLGQLTTQQVSTLSQWQTLSGCDINSQFIDPLSTSPGSWISTTDLHFSGSAETPAIQPVNRLDECILDFDGETRAMSCWPGADEIIGFTVPISLSDFLAE